MSGKRLAAAAALGVLVATGAFAQTTAPGNAVPASEPGGEPDATPARGADASADTRAAWSPLLETKTPSGPADPLAWSRQQVDETLAHCAVLLKGLDVVAVAGPPLREGPECGTPVPMKLMSVGRSPQITLSPPPTLTCDMVATLARWLEKDVQPLARQHLGAPIARVETMSSYSCRKAYGRAGGRVSEHGKADAVDIGAFATARGQAALIVADWGPTARQIAAEAAAAGRSVTAAAHAKAPIDQTRNGSPMAPVKGGLALQDQGGQRPATAAGMVPLDQRPSAPIGLPGITLEFSRAGDRAPAAFGFAAPSQLGGPKPQAADEDPTATASAGGKTDFLRAAHRSACKVFNTVLGPEANNAHLNHFHLDMAERINNTKICE